MLGSPGFTTNVSVYEPNWTKKTNTPIKVSKVETLAKTKNKATKHRGTSTMFNPIKNGPIDSYTISYNEDR